VFKRAYVNGLSMSKVNNALTSFGGCTRIEDVHPMQFGIGAAQGAHAAPARHADREPVRVLSVARL
jgi:hypothetical protein